MNVALITLHRVFNYGSALQAYATQTLVEKAGHTCKIIDYISEQRTAKRQVLYVPEGYKVLSPKGLMYIAARVPNYLKKYAVFHRFWKNRLHLTEKSYINAEDLRHNPPQADCYLTGSDQVWNSDYNEGIDKSFFLDFGNDSTRRVAYAASIGMDSIAAEEQEEFLRLVNRYQKITVREVKAQQLLRAIGYTKEAPPVLDPTLMLDKQEWGAIEKAPSEKDYILVMVLYNEDCGIPALAKALSEKTGLPIVELVWNPFKKREWKTNYGNSPEEFLGYVHHARYIITNSFHVSAFSVNYGKQFLAVKRQMYNNRVESLLGKLGISDRYIEPDGDVTKILEPIDYQNVHAKLTSLREESFSQLQSLFE